MNEHWEVLPPATEKTWSLLQQLPEIKQFYLAGGTGLALQIGHRISRDLDFFTPAAFTPDDLVQKLGALGNFELELKSEKTAVGILNETKLSFLGYPYSLLDGTDELRGIQVAAVSDIACMKLDAVSSRGTKRDFIDLFCIARAISLTDMFALFQKKYAAINYNMMHVKKSLVFFDDADADPMPDMLQPVAWDEAKAFFRSEIQKLP